MASSAVDTLREAIDELLDVDPDTLTDSEVHGLVVALGQQSTRLQAAWCQHIDPWVTRQIWAADGSKAAYARLARETHLRPGTARQLVSRSRQLTTMPVTAAAYATGEIGGEHVDLIGSCNRQWPDADFHDDEAALVEKCRTPTFRRAAQAIEYWKQRADPDGADTEAAIAREGRHASIGVTWGGEVVLNAVLDPLGGEIFNTELDRLCEQLRLADLRDGVERTVQQRRADALVEMAMRSATAPADGLRPRPLLTVTIGIEPFTWLCQTAAGIVITPGMLIPYLDAAEIERIVYDPPNRRIEASHRRRFTGALRRIIEVRDRHCQHDSGCDTPATRCDVDHIEPWAETQFTCICNGQLLCATHNRITKNHGPRPIRRQRGGEQLPLDRDDDQQPWTATNGTDGTDGSPRSPPKAG
jgi:hypothetical protein